MNQQIQQIRITPKTITKIVNSQNSRKIFLVCGQSFYKLRLAETLQKSAVPYEMFTDFSPNPLYEDICKGVHCFLNSGCDFILAVGGGSSIDVAKCISVFSGISAKNDFLNQKTYTRSVPLTAIPTTAGSGSESTGFAVLYKNKTKISVKSDAMLPDIVLLDGSLLQDLPDYHKKSTMMDALCQALESWWSVKSTPESIALARQAIWRISRYRDTYLMGDPASSEEILLAANYSGRAIQIIQTTAPHAMSYKLTGIYGLAHGHAVALCFPWVWKYMLGHQENCVDPRGQLYLLHTFQKMADALGYNDPYAAADGIEQMLRRMDLTAPSGTTEEHIQILTDAVNPERLNNSPIQIDSTGLEQIYRQLLLKNKGGNEHGCKSF